MSRARIARRWYLLLASLALLVLGLATPGCGATVAEEGNLADASQPESSVDARVDPAPADGGDGDGAALVDARAPSFGVAAAASTANTAMTVTFDAPPDAAQATDLAHYSVPGLALSGTPALAGKVVTLVTSAQVAQAYTVTVSGVTRAADAEPLSTASATFQGRGAFNVASAAAITTKKLTVTFDAAPDPATATNLANYDVPGLTLSTPLLAGNVVTLTTTAQAAQSYTVTVSGVTRASDGEPLGVATADFTGRAPFVVATAASPNSLTMTVTFSAPPTAAEATTLASYTVPGLVLSGTPVLSGSTVTLTTSVQIAQAYTVTVTNMTRASDAEELDVAAATFAGTPVLAPTVTNVVVTATLPNNGTIAYNTGATTVTITGTELLTVDCAGATKGVSLGDLDGVDVAVGTRATSCTVTSDTQLIASFPAGIRTNGATGWNVRVTNVTDTNATSAVRFVPVAGLLISEVYTGTSGGTDHEFIELFNPTATSLDSAALGVRIHTRSSTGVDTNKTLTAVTQGVIPSHGFLLVVSSASVGDAWYASRDYTYSASLVGNGGVYVSLSSTKNELVIDKLGWGTQPAGGYEGTAIANLASGQSAARKPAAGAGHATDTDANLDDFNAASATLTPRGTADGAQP